MQQSDALRTYRPQASLDSGPSAVLGGRPLAVARAAWLLVATTSLILFVIALPFQFRQLLAPCAGQECHAWRLGAFEHLALREIGFSSALYATYAVALTTALALACATVAFIIFWRRSNEWIALLSALWLVTFGAMAHAPQALAASQPLLRPLIQVLDELGWTLLPSVFLFTFPNGRFVPRWTRWLFIAFVGLGLAGSALELYFPHLAEGPGQQVVWFSIMLTGIAMQVYRYRRVSDPAQRQQTKWVVFGLVVAASGIAIWAVLLQPLPMLTEPGLPALSGRLLEITTVNAAFLVVALAMGYSVLRYRLWDIDLIINRTLIWGLLTAFVVGTYVLVVGTFGALFQTRSAFLPSMLATGLIALLFHPLRQRLQRGVNRLMYGERDEPYAVLSRLGKQLEATLVPDALLPTIVETVAQALRLPYVAITLRQNGDFQVAAVAGNEAPQPLVLPLTYQQEVIGQLLCAPRAGGPPFNDQERRLLEDIARQAGVALHAQRLAADVQRARQRLVIAREEERRRIRRDLHDGLGPALASQTLKLGSARALLQRDPAAAAGLLQQLETDSMAALEDIRRLVYNLRPPALDELGLLRAIEQSAPHRPGLDIAFDLPQTLPPLSAAAEVAVYRIVQEALANVVRHAQAKQARVHLAANGELYLTITDDGEGLPENVHAGVGLHSMRERAEELGGAFKIVSAPAAGTKIEVRLPLRPLRQEEA